MRSALLIAAGTGDPVVAVFAILGGILGAMLGQRIRQYDPSAPGCLAVVGFFLLPLFAYTILRALVLSLVVGGFALLVYKFWPVISQWCSDLGDRWLGWILRRHAAGSYRHTITTLHREHDARVNAILDLDVDLDMQDQLLEEEKQRYEDAVLRLNRT